VLLKEVINCNNSVCLPMSVICPKVLLFGLPSISLDSKRIIVDLSTNL